MIRMELPLIKLQLVARRHVPVIHQFWRHSNHQKISKFVVLNSEKIRYHTRTTRTYAGLKEHTMGVTSSRKFEIDEFCSFFLNFEPLCSHRNLFKVWSSRNSLLSRHNHTEFFVFEFLKTIFINILLPFYQADQGILTHFI